jgi:hypothetical protein
MSFYARLENISLNRLHDDRTAGRFAHQLLETGNGTVPVDLESGRISLPPNYCRCLTSKEELIGNVFPDIATNYRNHNWLGERAILAAKNKDVNDLNNIIQSYVPGEGDRCSKCLSKT